MARKADDDETYFCACQACKKEGPRRSTALQAVEAARKTGWEVSADVQLCTPCAFRVNRLERLFINS